MTKLQSTHQTSEDHHGRGAFRKFGSIFSRAQRGFGARPTDDFDSSVDDIAERISSIPTPLVEPVEKVRVAPSSAPEHQPLLGPQRSYDTGKPCLVLDLDETLVHSSFAPDDALQPDFVVPFEYEGLQTTVYVLRRPHCQEFLRELAKHYELVIFTASINVYADPLLDRIDPEGLISARLYREHCVLWQGAYFIKDLSILGRPLEKTLILDNSAVSYLFQPENGIPTTSWYDDTQDTELSELLPFLRYIAGKPNLGAAVRAALAGADHEAPRTPQIQTAHRAALKALESYARASPLATSQVWGTPQRSSSLGQSALTQARRD